jgi:hypothetical protein
MLGEGFSIVVTDDQNFYLPIELQKKVYVLEQALADHEAKKICILKGWLNFINI